MYRKESFAWEQQPYVELYVMLNYKETSYKLMGPHQKPLGIWRRNYETGERNRVICWFSEPETGLSLIEQIEEFIMMLSQTQKRLKLSQEVGVRGFLEGSGGD